MIDFQYKHAPITEAVVEFRFPTFADKKKCDKAIKHFKKNYADYNPVSAQRVKLEIKPKSEPRTQTTELIRNIFSSEDMTQQLHITENSFLISQLAPYVGWEEFQKRIKRDWEVWRNDTGFHPVERIGMRYINRIDLPIDGPILRYEDYVNVYPTLPPLLDPCSYHSVNVRVNLDDLQSVLNLKSALVESPLPNHLAIVIDLDIGRQYTSPPSNDEIYSFISQARIKKNEIFEACITDKARELFR